MPDTSSSHPFIHWGLEEGGRIRESKLFRKFGVYPSYLQECVVLMGKGAFFQTVKTPYVAAIAFCPMLMRSSLPVQQALTPPELLTWKF